MKMVTTIIGTVASRRHTVKVAGCDVSRHHDTTYSGDSADPSHSHNSSPSSYSIR